MENALNLLVIEDMEEDFMLVVRHLQRQELAVSCTRVGNLAELAAALEAGLWDAVLSSYQLENLDFHQIFDVLQEKNPLLPVLIVSGSLREDEAVEWLKRGVADFVGKDRLARLVPAIQRALREAEERRNRQAAEEALRRSREMLRLITDIAPALISYIDTNYHYRLANRGYERWLGMRPEEIVGQPVAGILGETAWKVVRPFMERALRGETVSFEDELNYRHAGRRWVRVNYVPDRDAGGEVRGFAVLVQDIQDLKRNELALADHNVRLEEVVAARTAQLAAMNQELQAFTYAVSHDLKAPLRNINAFSALLEKKCADRLEGEGLEFLGFIQQGVKRMNSLIEDLLAYARVEQRPLEALSINLEMAVQEVMAEKAEEIRLQGADVRVDLPSLAVRADPEGLAQVLRNLLDNALKFSANAKPPRVEIGGKPLPEGGCQFWVRDNGIGFSMAQHERIFQIFQRLHSISEFPGTGIGLALIKRAMDRMGGKVWAESEPGQGATFFLELPGG